MSVTVVSSFKHIARFIVPLVVIGFVPVATIPSPPPISTLVTVPTQVVLELKVDQSALDKAPRLVALAVGRLKVRVPLLVIGLPVTLKSEPEVPTAPHISVTVPPASVTVKVNVSEDSSLVIAIPEPTKVKVSLFVSAVIVSCPVTAKFLNINCSEPLSIFVTWIVSVPLTDIPVPAVTSSTLLLKSIQSVDNNLPVVVDPAIGIFNVISPLEVIGLPETFISVPPSPVQKPTLVTVPMQVVFALNEIQSALDKAPRFVALAVGKFNVIVPEVFIGLPETLKSVPVVPLWTHTSVTVPTHPVAVVPIVIKSWVSSEVRVIPVPADKQKVSALLSAVIVHEPTTAIFLKKHWSEPLSVLHKEKLPSVDWFNVKVAFPERPSVPEICIWQLLADVIVLLIVTEPSALQVTISIFAPSTRVNVDALEPAVIVFWPETATFLNMFWEEPLSQLFKVRTSLDVWLRLKHPPPLSPVPPEISISQLLATVVEDIVTLFPSKQVLTPPVPTIHIKSLLDWAV